MLLHVPNCFLLFDSCAFATQAVLLARIQAIMAGDKELANRMFMPAKMQAQAVKQALSLTSHACTLSHEQAKKGSTGLHVDLVVFAFSLCGLRVTCPSMQVHAGL